MSSATNVLAVCLSWATLHPLQYIYISPVGMIPSYNFVVANAYIERFWIVELNYFISWDFDSSADDFLNKSILNIWIFVTVILNDGGVLFLYWILEKWLLKFYNCSTLLEYFCFKNLILRKILIFSITRIPLERSYCITVVRISWNNTKILLNFISIRYLEKEEEIPSKL